MAEINGKATERISGHLSGSRRYGTSNRVSDWDYGFQDNAATRAFLTAAGFKHVVEITQISRTNETSYWKHRYYNCEVFLSPDCDLKQEATKIMRWFQWCAVMQDKVYRVRAWNALQIMLREMMKIRR
jgi:hypothetical protein